MSHLDTTMDKVQRKVNKTHLEFGWKQHKYLYTITAEPVFNLDRHTRDIEEDNEDDAIEKYLDHMEEYIREDTSIDIDFISTVFNSVQRSVKVIDVREIEWIDPRQMELPGVAT